jgi:hypothetical protein
MFAFSCSNGISRGSPHIEDLHSPWVVTDLVLLTFYMTSGCARLVSLNQLAIVFGILPAQIVNWLIARPVPIGSTAQEILVSWNGLCGWR